VHVELREEVPGVAPADALAWWSDFQEGHVDHAFVHGQRRTVTREGEGAVRMEDAVRWSGVTVFRERTVARVVGDAVVFEGENSLSTFRGAYSFEPGGDDGTLVRLHATITLRSGLRWSAPIARLVARAILVADLRAHAREMARDLSGQQVR
jgi:hypothetical protein